MPQYDQYHENVRMALHKDGWVINDDPYILEYKGLRLYADLGVEKFMKATQGKDRIVVEIKSFTSLSLITELEKAIGQYLIYRTLLIRTGAERQLYLAIPEKVEQNFFQRPAIRDIIVDYQVNLLVFNPETETITQWIS